MSLGIIGGQLKVFLKKKPSYDVIMGFEGFRKALDNLSMLRGVTLSDEQ